jgi:hypothetical protein
MNYVTRRSHRMQKHKNGVTCPGAPFMESAPGPPMQEKLCVNVSCPGRSGMDYVTRRCHRMQKHEICNVSRCAFCEKGTRPTGAWKIVRPRFMPWTHRNALRDLYIPLDVKTQVWRNMSRHAFYGNRTEPTRA